MMGSAHRVFVMKTANKLVKLGSHCASGVMDQLCQMRKKPYSYIRAEAMDDG